MSPEEVAMKRRKDLLGLLSVVLVSSVAALGAATPAIVEWIAHRRSHRCCEPDERKTCGWLSGWDDGRSRCETDGPCCCSFGVAHVACGCGRSASSTPSGWLKIGPEPDPGVGLNHVRLGNATVIPASRHVQFAGWGCDDPYHWHRYEPSWWDRLRAWWGVTSRAVAGSNRP